MVNIALDNVNNESDNNEITNEKEKEAQNINIPLSMNEGGNSEILRNKSAEIPAGDTNQNTCYNATSA